MLTPSDDPRQGVGLEKAPNLPDGRAVTAEKTVIYPSIITRGLWVRNLVFALM